MHTYYDTGALVPLYVEEVFSEAVTAHVESRKTAVQINQFQQLEMENALHLKVFRGELKTDMCRAVLARIKSDLRAGRLVLRPANWVGALEDSRRICARATETAGCSTLDIIHVAIAVQWGCVEFVSADDRQIKAARAVDLAALDLRCL